MLSPFPITYLRLDFLHTLHQNNLSTDHVEANMRTQLFSIKAGYETDLQKCKTMPRSSLIFLFLKTVIFHLKNH